MANFSLPQFGALCATSVQSIKQMAARGHIPGLIGGGRRRDCKALDIFATVIADDLARDGGLDRSVASRAVHQAWRTLTAIAYDLDAEPSRDRHLVVAFAEDGRVFGLGGELPDVLDLLRSGEFGSVYRIVGVNVRLSADRIRERARQHGIALGRWSEGLTEIRGTAACAASTRGLQ